MHAHYSAGGFCCPPPPRTTAQKHPPKAARAASCMFPTTGGTNPGWGIKTGQRFRSQEGVPEWGKPAWKVSESEQHCLAHRYC